MTTETRITVEPADVAGIEFECRTCKARTVRPLSTDNYVPERCKSGLCEAVFFADGSIEYSEVKHALDLIGRYCKATGQPFSLRFELKPSASQTSTGRQ